MAAILKLRRGTSFTNPSISEPFFNTNSETLEVGYGTTTGEHITLTKLGINTGSIEFTGDISGSNLSLSGNANIVGNITLGGDIFLGDGDNTTDKINVNASLSGSLVPDTDGVYDLGSTSFRYNNIHVLSASIENLNVGGSGILSSSQQIIDYNTFLEINGMNVVSGSSQIDLTQTANYISGIKTRLNSETVISGSSQVQIDLVNGFISFSSSVDSRLDAQESFSESLDATFEEIASGTHTLVSGSSQIDVNTTQNFQSFSSSVDNRLDEVESTSSINETNITELFSTSSNHEDRVIDLESTGSNHETRITDLESFSSSLDNTFVTETELTDATSSLSASLTETDDNFESRITEIETTFSSSVDSRLDSQELFSSSIDTTIKTKMNLDGVLSGSSQITNGSGILSSSNEDFNTFSSSIDGRVDLLETTFSSSVDSRLDSLEGDSHTHSNKAQLDVINQDLSNTSNVTFNDITASGNVIVSGDLTVLGTATEIQTSELVIKDKLITVASGSTNSAEADGSGIEIDGAGKSIIWDDATQSFILNAKVSSSVGFKGDGSELTGVTAADVEYLDVLNKPTLVSGSSQISFNGIIDKPTLFSGSSQVNADTITNFDSNVKDKLNSDGIVSQSSQIDLNDTQNFTTFSSSIDSRLDSQESFSSSIDTLFEEISSGTHTLVTGSSQIDVTQTTNIQTLATTGSNIFVGNQTITGSVFITGSDFTWKTSFTENFPTEVAKDIIVFEDFDGSDGITYTNNHLRLQNVPVVGAPGDHTFQLNFGSGYGTQMAVGPRIAEFLVHPSGSVNSGSLSILDNGDKTTTIDLYATNVHLGKFDSTITINASNIITDSPITSSNTIEASFFYGDGSQLENIVASEITYENITGLPNGLISGSSQIDVTQTTNYSSIRQYDDTDNTTHLNSLGVVSGSTYSSPSQGTLRATINGSNSDVNLGLQSTDTPTFNSLTASNLPEHDNTHYDAIFKGTTGEFGYRTLATAAFYHVSNSIDDGNSLVLGNAGAVKTYVDAKIIAASAGDITEVNAGPGLGGGSTIGAATLNLDTGSQHFIDGVTGIVPTLPDGLVSSSDQVTQSLDTRYVNVSGDTVTGDLIISGDLTVNGTTTTINTTNLNVEDNIIELNFGGSATNGGILVKDVTGGSTISGSLLWDSVNDYWVAGKGGFETQILTTNNSTSDLSEGIRLYYTDSRVKSKLDAEGVVSGSVLTTLDGLGILSSSNENFTDFSSSVDGRIDLLESFSSSLDNDFVTELELNTATQSLQDSIDLKLDITTYTPFSTSVDSRLDGLEGVTSENPLTFTDTSTIDFTRVGDIITADVIGGIVSGSSQVISILDSLNSYTSSNDTNQTTQNGRLTSLETETGSIATEQSIQDGRLDNLESYTASVDSLYEEISSGTHTLVSGSSQIDVTQTTNYSSINQFSDAKVKLKLDADGVFSSSEQVNADTITNFDSNVLDKINDIGIISGSDQLTGSLVDLESAQTIGGTKTFNDIVVNGTGSFAYFVSTESELNVIGQSFIVLNNDTPTQRYAGLAVYDSGSTGVTASLEFDGQTNDWFYEYSDDDGVTTDHGAVLFGPEYSTKGSPTYPTNNTIQKGNGGHHLLDSNITDDGSTITLGSNTYVNGALSVSGSLLQTSAGNFGITSAGSISLLTAGGGDGVVIAANGNTTIYGAVALQDIPAAGTSTAALVVGGSNVVSQRTLGSNAFTSTAIPTNNNELTNGAGYITGFDITTQTDSKYLRSDVADIASGIITFSNTTQSTTNTTGAVIVSGGVGIAKTLNVGEDVVAYASSDRRLKDNILPIENPLQKINSIGGYSFDWNVEKQHIYNGKDYGVIAQEIEEILPELVDTRENGYKAVKYDKLVSLLIEGIKELSQEVDELKKQINK